MKYKIFDLVRVLPCVYFTWSKSRFVARYDWCSIYVCLISVYLKMSRRMGQMLLEWWRATCAKACATLVNLYPVSPLTLLIQTLATFWKHPVLWIRCQIDRIKFYLCKLLWRLLFLDSWAQCLGSVIFWRGSGSADSYLWLTDPDPSPDPAQDPTPNPIRYFSDFKDAQFFVIFFLITYPQTYYL
jgi:hypothetical protein